MSNAEGHHLCSNNWGFLSATMNLCSNCYGNLCLRQQTRMKSTFKSFLSSFVVTDRFHKAKNVSNTMTQTTKQPYITGWTFHCKISKMESWFV
ncbi:unnamed protein product [Brassica rapa subsp. trilocularis]